MSPGNSPQQLARQSRRACAEQGHPTGADIVEVEQDRRQGPSVAVGQPRTVKQPSARTRENDFDCDFRSARSRASRKDGEGRTRPDQMRQ